MKQRVEVSSASGEPATPGADDTCHQRLGGPADALDTIEAAGTIDVNSPIEGPGEPTDAVRGPDALATLDGVVTGLTYLAEVDPTRLGSDHAARLLDGLDRARAATDTATLTLLVELIDRGEAPGTGHGLVDWLTARSPSISRSHAIDLTRVAAAGATERGVDRSAHAPVLQAVGRGEVSLRRASMALRALGRIRPVLDDATYAGDVALVLDAARRRETFTERDLARITDRLVATAMTDRDHDQRDDGARSLRGVAESALAGGSVIRFIVDAEPEGAAAFRAVMTSAMSAPSPADDGTPDRRSASARRYDALIAVLTRGMSSPEGQPTTARTQVVVTVPFEGLASTLRARERTGDERGPAGTGLGAGFTATGDLLSPATVRRLACDAEIVPAVLGGRSEILDLGRSQRLVTPGQRRALAHRDAHCSYPGCSIPAGWCDAHHIVHWADGGRSDLANYALLCQRHHTHVHQRGMVASVDTAAAPGTAVRWRQRE